MLVRTHERDGYNHSVSETKDQKFKDLNSLPKATQLENEPVFELKCLTLKLIIQRL